MLPKLHHFLDGVPSVFTDPATTAAVVIVYHHISRPAALSFFY
jgi:hypothetical protein